MESSHLCIYKPGPLHMGAHTVPALKWKGLIKPFDCDISFILRTNLYTIKRHCESNKTQ